MGMASAGKSPQRASHYELRGRRCCRFWSDGTRPRLSRLRRPGESFRVAAKPLGKAPEQMGPGDCRIGGDSKPLGMERQHGCVLGPEAKNRRRPGAALELHDFRAV